MRPKSIATVVVRLAPRRRTVSSVPTLGVGEHLLGLQRPDLADRADQGGLADAEAAGDEDLQRERDRAPRQSARSPLITALRMSSSGSCGRGAAVRACEIEPVGEQVAEQDPDDPERRGRARRRARRPRSAPGASARIARCSGCRCDGPRRRPAARRTTNAIRSNAPPSRGGPGRRSSRTGGPPDRRRRRASRACRGASAGHRRAPAGRCSVRAGEVMFWPTRVTSIAISYATRPMSASASAEHREAGALAGGGDEEERRLHLDDGLAHRPGAEVPAGALGQALEAGGHRRQVLGVLPGQRRWTRPSAGRRPRARPPAGRPAPARPDRRAASRGS